MRIEPRYIETVRNKGYRLIPVVETAPAANERTDAAAPLAASGRRRSLLVGRRSPRPGRYWLAGTAERPPPLPNSVAVLPFENPSPDPDDAYFAAGHAGRDREPAHEAQRAAA